MSPVEEYLFFFQTNFNSETFLGSFSQNISFANLDVSADFDEKSSVNLPLFVVNSTDHSVGSLPG